MGAPSFKKESNVLDDIVTAITSYLIGRETAWYRTIGFTSFMAGILFFIFFLLEGVFFSGQRMTMVDILVLAGLSLFVGVSTFLILIFLRWYSNRKSKESQS